MPSTTAQPAKPPATPARDKKVEFDKQKRTARKLRSYGGNGSGAAIGGASAA